MTVRLAAIGALALGAVSACGPPPSSAASPADAGWERVASLPEARSFHRAARGSDGRIYVFGGRFGPEMRAGYNDDGRFPVVAYDPGENAWSEVPSAPKREIRSVTHGRKLEARGHPESELPYEYPPGAADSLGRIHWITVFGPVVFDPRTNRWLQGAQPVRHGPVRRWEGPVGRYLRNSGATATGPDGRIYLVGGMGKPLEDLSAGYELLGSLEIYDPEAETWSEGAPLLQPRQLCAAAFGPDGKLYVFGGYAGRGGVRKREGESEAEYARRSARQRHHAYNALRSVEAYDPETDTWEERAPMPAGRENLAAVRGPDGRIYVLGGSPSYADPAPRPQVFVYDPREDSWSEGPPMQHARFNHAAAVDAEGRIYAISGIGGERKEGWRDLLRDEPRYQHHALRSVERLDLSANGEEAVGASAERPE